MKKSKRWLCKLLKKLRAKYCGDIRDLTVREILGIFPIEITQGGKSIDKFYAACWIMHPDSRIEIQKLPEDWIEGEWPSTKVKYEPT